MNVDLKQGFGYGLLATLGMTLLMLVGTFLKVSPMPTPIPIALAGWVFGALPMPALVGLGLVAHFLYGGLAGAIFSWFIRDRAILWLAFGWGIILWLGMQLIFLPLLGWGLFGMAITLRIAVATLILHLVYGGILGWGLSRHHSYRTLSPTS